MSKEIEIIVPVLVIGFNRPEVLRQAIAKLRESQPRRMYLACDGARENIPSEDALVAEVRSIMEKEIDWPCEKYYRYNENNKGCEVTESEAISWVLSKNDYVIIDEDDVLLPYSFLRFAQEMLYQYKDNEQIYQVTSCNYTPMSFPDDADYTFSLTAGHIWGWATWKRAWNHFDLYVKDYEQTICRIAARTDITESEKMRVRRKCNRLMGGGKITWDVVWDYVKWRDGGLTIVPRTHLSSNVGTIGLHSKVRTKQHFLPYDETFIAAQHPKSIKRNLEYDEYHFLHWLKKPPFFIQIWQRGWGFLKRMLFQT